MKFYTWMAIAGTALALLTAAGCSNQDNVRAADRPVKVEPPSDPDVFTVDKPQQFPLSAAEARRTHDSLDLNGVVAADVSRTVPVMSLTGGRVIEIDARLGDDVRKGQVLLKIASNDLAGAFADYQKAQSAAALARRALDRTKDLYDHGAAPRKDVEAAEDADRKAQVDVNSAAEKIRILGGDVERPSSVVEVRAPVSGTIVDQQVQASGGVKSLDNSPNLFTIADLSELWVLCDVYENNLAQVRLGDFAEVHLTAYPERVFRARVSNISSLLDPNTRTAKVRLQLGNPGRMLRPGMFATATFRSQSAHDRVAIPATAVLRLHDQDWVFRPLSENQFRRQRVQAAETSPDGYQFIAGGLQPGDQVVRNALQFSTTVEK